MKEQGEGGESCDASRVRTGDEQCIITSEYHGSDGIGMLFDRVLDFARLKAQNDDQSIARARDNVLVVVTNGQAENFTVMNTRQERLIDVPSNTSGSSYLYVFSIAPVFKLNSLIVRSTHVVTRYLLLCVSLIDVINAV